MSSKLPDDFVDRLLANRKKPQLVNLDFLHNDNILENKRKCFLNKNLDFNIPSKECHLFEYYIHTYTKNINIQNYESVKSIITNFSLQRTKNANLDDFIILNRSNLANYYDDLDDKDFYVEILGCIFCKDILNNYAALYLHYKLCHPNYLFFNIKHSNTHTNMKEAHIVAFKISEEIQPNKIIINSKDDQKVIDQKIIDSSIFICYTKDEKEVLLLKALENKNDLERITSNTINQKQDSYTYERSNNKHLVNSLKQNFRQYLPNVNSLIDNNLILFDPITIEPLDSNKLSNSYELLDDSYVIKTQEKWIDELCDNAGLNEKQFMKLWNRHIEKMNL